MAGFRCECCGEQHSELPRDLGYDWPIDYLLVPDVELADRVRATPDFCVIDGDQCFIRGVLELPVLDDGPSFGWGVWARVVPEDFARYMQELDEQLQDELPVFSAVLTGGLLGYEDIDELPKTVEVHPLGQRPSFHVVSATHPLGIDQRNGISPQKAHEFVTGVGKRQAARRESSLRRTWTRVSRWVRRRA